MKLKSSQNRAYALDALRGIAILAMLLSGQMPFDQNALPSWMYHAQEPPPTFDWQGNLPGISWVDLVFPFFLFCMGAAFPLALSRRMNQGTSRWKLGLFILERGFLLGFFALFVQLIRPYTINPHPTTFVWLQALLGFLILFPILTRLPDYWSLFVKSLVRTSGWIGVILFCWLTTYPDGSGFKLTRSDIIIIVLTNMAVAGSVVWMLTREKLLVRLGLIGVLFAVRMSNMPQATEGWVHDIWQWHPPSIRWIYQLYYLQYLCIVIPGTVAGDLILKWTRCDPAANEVKAGSKPGLMAVAGVMISLLLVLLCGLKARWLISTTIITLVLCLIVNWMLSKPGNETAKLYANLFQWATYWLILGLVFEPFEGGIKKDHPTLSYYFVTCGLANCMLIFFSILIDVFRKKHWFGLLIDNGQNPMIAYAGINNFITPLLALTGGATLLTHLATTPWLGFCKGAIITLLMALTVSLLTRKKIFWRT